MEHNDYMLEMETCAERMKTLREGRGLTMNELAEEIDMSPCSVYYYEHCKHIPNIITLIKYAMYFGVTTDYLLGLKENGKWIWETEDIYRCTNCGSRTRVDEKMNKPLYSFCPYCGAKME